jgi:hypothetical protein
VHDLALDVSARGSGVAHDSGVLYCNEHVMPVLPKLSLIAVQGSQTFWQRHGFQPTVPAQGKLNDTLASYGDDTQMMWRRL